MLLCILNISCSDTEAKRGNRCGVPLSQPQVQLTTLRSLNYEIHPALPYMTGL